MNDEQHRGEGEQPLPNALVGSGSGVGCGDSSGSLRIEWPTVTDDAEAQGRSRWAAEQMIKRYGSNSEDEYYLSAVNWARERGYVTDSDLQNQFGLQYERSRSIMARMLSEGILDQSSMRKVVTGRRRPADGWRVKA